MSDETIIGPVQMLMLGFEDTSLLKGEILAELQRLKEADLIRLVDLLFVAKDDDGEITVAQLSDLSEDEAMEYGAVAGALLGLGMAGEEGAEAGAIVGAEAGADGHILDESDAWEAAEVIPPGMAAGIALIEHRWAIPLRDAVVRAGGVTLADEWIHAKDLIAAGLVVSESALAAHGEDGAAA
jgi:uncharacterized membrane protein